ncbi:beta-lactamase family protein [Phyllobacterium sp. 628]|uniref:serine hydrolase n=1 Tax=Phyllobacterium sp. 628 TaxID=2718938 RepID=UPI001662666A|nr:serine hydrolase [Phyllobacterium sp. 628]QND52859.1 beta-lactamase family protein [Phyllobacterium sp. 628]
MVRIRWISACTLAACLALSGTARAQDLPTQVSVAQMTAGNGDTKLVANVSFLPSADAAEAYLPFTGTINIPEAAMVTEPAKFKSNAVLGKDPQIFPAVSLSFITYESDLVPVQQDLIRIGSTANGRSFWDMIVQPGKVWSEPDDDGWSRASFPFQLVNSLEGETHTGIALFLYKEGEISNLRYQIVQQTAPFYVEDYFTAAGYLRVTYDGDDIAASSDARDAYARAQADAEKLGTWAELEAKVGKEKLEGFDSTIPPNELVLDGLMLDNIFYLKSCPTPMGELPYCNRQRFGVWSVTKAAANAVAMLRIAEKYGPQIFDTKITDYISEAKDVPGWQTVTFGDALNMATGMGYGSPNAEPVSITEPLGNGGYAPWFEARTEKDKIATLLKQAKPYAWGPGKIARYRDEDMFLLGVAMTRFLKQKEGPSANVWDFLVKEVYQPIGIHVAAINKTIEANPTDDQPLMAFGYYPTIGDLVKIARLYQNGGKLGDTQILNAEKLADILPSAQPVGLPTGSAERPFYHKAFWRGQLQSGNGCSVSYPVMSGWGMNFVSLMPKGVTTIRLAKDWDGNAGASDMSSLAGTADKLVNFCQ